MSLHHLFCDVERITVLEMAREAGLSDEHRVAK